MAARHGQGARRVRREVPTTKAKTSNGSLPPFQHEHYGSMYHYTPDQVWS
jgi:hypothetical protein